MQFHADKCFTIHLIKKRKTAEFNYTLHNHILEVTKDSKYLGVTFSSDLCWTSHINNISAKANRTIGFLRRKIHSCPKEVKAAAYTTLVRPSIEYASSVWDPYTRNNIHQLEAIQRRAARFVYNNFYDREPGVVTSMISRLQWESLEQEPKQEQHSCTKQLTTQLMSMRNTFSHNQTTEPEVMQPTEHCIPMLKYIDILSSHVPSSPRTPYHQLYVKSTPLISSKQGQGPSPYQCYPRCKYVHSVFNCIYNLLLTVQKGHARRVNTQYRVFS